MISNLPEYISAVFLLMVVCTLFLFYWVIKNSNNNNVRKLAELLFVFMTIWVIFQTFVALQNIYNSDTDVFPPKIILIGILPTILIIIFMFATSKGRQFIDSLPLKNLIYLNLVRVPVEIVLFLLYIHKLVPEIMTFEGWNFDILAGILVPFVFYFGFANGRYNKPFILIWNLICLGLLINIVGLAMLSAPSPIQKFGFEQPNVAILYFPFSLLPTFIVPIIFFGHLASIRQIIVKKNINQT